MPHKFKIIWRKNDKFVVQFLYNTEIMVWSASYRTKSSAKNLIEIVKKNASGAAIVDLSRSEATAGYQFEIVQSKNGQFYVRFVASNGEPMLVSETYRERRNALACAESIAANAAPAQVEDLTYAGQ